jgi:hypothetical protein
LANTTDRRMKHAFPFSGNRFELEGEHTYFLQPDSFGRIQAETPKPVYLTGPRGTGKTTLLKAFDFNERRSNASLREQLGEDPFASPVGPFIGVYFRVPDIQLGLIEYWGTGQQEEDIGKVLAYYIDLQWLEELAQLIALLLAEGVLTASPIEERRAVGAIVNEYPTTFSGSKAPQTVAELRTAIKRFRADLDAAAKRNANWGDVIAQYDSVQQPGTFGRFVANELATLCKRANVDDSRPWHFRVCIDEADFLSDLQLKALNSSVRLCRWPVFPVAAFGGVARDYASTLFPRLSVQDADRDIIDLSGFLTDRRFKELAEGVASARVSRLMHEPTEVRLSDILGTFGINVLLKQILEESVSPQAKELLSLARELQSDPFFQEMPVNDASDQMDDDEGDDHELPIYQAFLISQLHLELPKPSDPSWRRRRQESGELRKKMVSAYLSICHSLKTQVRYASSRVLLRLSDMCVRDFLKFLNSLHRASGLPVQDFIRCEMHWRDQHEALLSASVDKSQSIKGQDLRAPRETEAIVNGLAKLTHLLQVQSSDGQHLRTSERGIFFLPAGRWNHREDRSAMNLRDACDIGFLRLLSSDDKQVSFRVHTSLAPAFEFSYRGAYYPSPLSWADIEKLAETRKDADLDRLAHTISSRLSKADNLSLFEIV